MRTSNLTRIQPVNRPELNVRKQPIGSTVGESQLKGRGQKKERGAEGGDGVRRRRGGQKTERGPEEGEGLGRRWGQKKEIGSEEGDGVSKMREGQLEYRGSVEREGEGS